ncbi:mitochondrial carrier domain-containing protein [Radiomyces spectabilis]|uniref:mitochondrial carrier domain-containing protein n=1 Tax=Radiomyces spectabilis TaxID=64574 RepID=UPI002220C670|nr:mitochondrial carrier domain-containing protein [Radiomyces spectabilis]KAI8376307.1 mitochondrial carrier domain-containing protein [Radiomyces spectabilis]
MATTATEALPVGFAIPKVAQDLVAGTVGGWAQVVVGHPFDTLKVRLQTQPSPPIYRNAMDCFRQLVAKEGPKGLYRGVASPLAGIGFCNAVVFMSNGEFRRILQQGDASKVLSLGEIAIAGSLAGTVMAFCNCPIELLKVKLQTQDPAGVIGASGKLEPPYKGVLDCGMRTVRANGPQGVYRGLGITLLRDSPSYAFYFVTYEGLKRVFQSMKSDPNAELSTLDLLMAGGLAGFGAWIPAYPQDVIKSRIQNDVRIKSVSAAVRSLLREGGPRAFFNGVGPTMARAFPANAATFFAYEMTMKAMS